MNKKNKTTRRTYKFAKQWQAVVAECRASNMTAIHWCKEHGVNINTYYNWCSKLKKVGMLPAKGECTNDVSSKASEKPSIEKRLSDIQAELAKPVRIDEHLQHTCSCKHLDATKIPDVECIHISAQGVDIKLPKNTPSYVLKRLIEILASR